MRRVSLKSPAAFTLIELLIAAIVGGFAMAAVFSGAMAMQRCFVAAEDFAQAKVDQARLSDYLAQDVRRATSVVRGTDGVTILTLKIPDYYDSAGQPRTPTITGYVASYGNPALPLKVVYRKVGSSIIRYESNGSGRVLAVNVEDFTPEIQDLGRVVKTMITFAPRFQRNQTGAARAATTIFNTTLLRNKRKAP